MHNQILYGDVNDRKEYKKGGKTLNKSLNWYMILLRESSKDHLSVIMSKTAPNVETEPPEKKNVNQILHLIHFFLLII